MAANRLQPKEEMTWKEFRSLMEPFFDGESATKALRDFIEQSGHVSRAGMYLLEITNNIIQSNNGTENLYQRIPPEVFGGMPEGGRRNVQASLISRAVRRSGPDDERISFPSGLTRIQEIIKEWSSRDNGWSDTPENDLEGKGFHHNPENDGSESRIYRNDSGRVFKTITLNHYNAFELLLDRIAIHNATFPEMALQVEGFGRHDDGLTNDGFVVIVSQPVARMGRLATEQDIDEGLARYGYERIPDSPFYVSVLDRTVLTDIDETNAFISPEGRLIVFDCQAFLKVFALEPSHPKRISVDQLLPDKKTSMYDSQAWRDILGKAYPETTEQQKSHILKKLRTEGSCQVPGTDTLLKMSNGQQAETRSGDTVIRHYDGDVLYGRAHEFENDKVYRIPEISYKEQSVDAIKKTIISLLPREQEIESLLFNRNMVGKTAAWRAGGTDRQYFRDCLKTYGMIPELIGDRYIVQAHPTNPDSALVMPVENIAFLLKTNRAGIDGSKEPLTEHEKNEILKGHFIERGGEKYFFDLDKGRINRLEDWQLKLRQSHAETKKQQRKPNKPKLT